MAMPPDQGSPKRENRNRSMQKARGKNTTKAARKTPQTRSGDQRALRCTERSKPGRGSLATAAAQCEREPKGQYPEQAQEPCCVGVPTRTRTWIDRLGGDCSILLNYGDPSTASDSHTMVTEGSRSLQASVLTAVPTPLSLLQALSKDGRLEVCPGKDALYRHAGSLSDNPCLFHAPAQRGRCLWHKGVVPLPQPRNGTFPGHIPGLPMRARPEQNPRRR